MAALKRSDNDQEVIDIPIQVGAFSLGDSPNDDVSDVVAERQRLEEIVGYAVAADSWGIDSFGLGEHHEPGFVAASPIAILAYIAAQTHRIRLATATTLLSVLDPIRVYEDFAVLDQLSGGRAELVVGRSGYSKPFELFGLDFEDRDELFVQHLDTLLRVLAQDGQRTRAQAEDASGLPYVTPRTLQSPLPVAIGIAGSPASAERAGAMGLPLVVAFIRGQVADLEHVVATYRAAGHEHGHDETLHVTVAVHFHAAATEEEAVATFPNYRRYFTPRPSDLGGATHLTREDFQDRRGLDGPLFIGTPDALTDKAVRLHERVGFDAFHAQVDWGGLPRDAVLRALRHLADDLAPALRALSSPAARRPGGDPVSDAIG